MMEKFFKKWDEVGKGDLCAFFFFKDHYTCTYLGQSKWLTAKLGIERVLTLFIPSLTVTLDDKDFGMSKKDPCSLQRH